MQSLTLLLGSALLPAAVSAQKVCLDDANFNGAAAFPTPWGSNGTCQDQMDKYFGQALMSEADCMAPMMLAYLEFQQVDMAAFSVQKHIALMAGCCTDHTFACSQYMPTHMESDMMCSNSTHALDKDGYCEPCYDQVIDGECAHCWELDARACTEQACVGFGVWEMEDDHGMCVTCNAHSLSSCHTQAACMGNGGVWNESTWHEPCLAACDQLDVRACAESECGSAGGHWKCYGGDCSCMKCCLGEVDCFHGSYHACTSEECTPTQDMPDVVMVNFTEWTMMMDNGTQTYMESQARMCSRCFHDGEEREAFGCLMKESCEAFMDEGFVWTCGFDAVGVHCCAICTHGDVEGCGSRAACEQHGGAWSEDMFGTAGHGHCAEDHAAEMPEVPTPSQVETPSCAGVSAEHAQWLTAIGFSPRKCTDC